MFCPQCGKQLPDTAMFCSMCGKQLSQAARDAGQGKMVAQSAPAQLDFSKSQLIKTYIIPEAVRKQASKYLSLELYTDKLVGLGGPNGVITYYFKNYIGVQWTPASIATQFAQLVFLTPQNAGNYVSANNLNNFVDANKIPFCSGMFSYVEANNYTKALYLDVKAAMDAYMAAENERANQPQTVQAALSPAEELKKFKELLDMGIISQEEFDAKKRQLLGL